MTSPQVLLDLSFLAVSHRIATRWGDRGQLSGEASDRASDTVAL
jgi:hypothetical protein